MRVHLPVIVEGLLVGLARQQHERDFLELRVATNLAADPEPVAVRELDGQQDQVGLVLVSRLESALRIGSELHITAKRCETGLHLTGEMVVRIHDQNLRHVHLRAEPG